MAESNRAVELIDITKSFPGVLANDDVNLSVGVGEIHAIVGENGAGKSTLMKILYGMQPPDSGEIRINGAPAVMKTPKDAIERGIGMVHQHFMLADNLSVLENVILGYEPRRPFPFPFLVDTGAARRKLVEVTRTGSAPIAQEGVKRIGELYRIEAELRGLEPEARLAAREAARDGLRGHPFPSSAARAS